MDEQRLLSASSNDYFNNKDVIPSETATDGNIIEFGISMVNNNNNKDHAALNTKQKSAPLPNRDDHVQKLAKKEVKIEEIRKQLTEAYLRAMRDLSAATQQHPATLAPPRPNHGKQGSVVSSGSAGTSVYDNKRLAKPPVVVNLPPRKNPLFKRMVQVIYNSLGLWTLKMVYDIQTTDMNLGRANRLYVRRPRLMFDWKLQKNIESL